jgi:hypothetical protein
MLGIEMIDTIREHKLQVVFVAIQATVVVYGVLWTAVILKANGYSEFPEFYPWLPRLVRHKGLIFLAVPALWCWWTVRYEEVGRKYANLVTFFSGFVILFLLWLVFSASAAEANHSFPRKAPVIIND